jgi:hypothetical protein
MAANKESGAGNSALPIRTAKSLTLRSSPITITRNYRMNGHYSEKEKERGASSSLAPLYERRKTPVPRRVGSKEAQTGATMRIVAIFCKHQ